MGAYKSTLKTRTGREVQAGVRKGKTGVHVSAGYDRKRGTAGADVTVTRKGKRSVTKSMTVGRRKK